MGLTLNDVRGAAIALLPPGKLFENVEEGSNLYKLLDAMSETDLRIQGYTEQLLIEMNPLTTYELLPDWEAALNLPDPDGPQNLSVADRRAAVVARLTALGGLTAQYLVDQAAAMGYAGATIQTFDFGTCESVCEMYLAERPWKKAFIMTLPASVDSLGATCDGAAEDFLGQPLNSHIENYINRLKPADTFGLYAYAG